MPEMHSLQVNSFGIEEGRRREHDTQEGMPEVRSLVQVTRSSVRRNATKNRQEGTEQQWPFPTTLLTKVGKPLKVNPDNFERATF